MTVMYRLSTMAGFDLFSDLRQNPVGVQRGLGNVMMSLELSCSLGKTTCPKLGCGFGWRIPRFLLDENPLELSKIHYFHHPDEHYQGQEYQRRTTMVMVMLMVMRMPMVMLMVMVMVMGECLGSGSGSGAGLGLSLGLGLGLDLAQDAREDQFRIINLVLGLDGKVL
ncbi:hypothetical protein F5X98DRAFT_359892 [Xylaria grammica]|nr:hypothetical protein F5X98DRAFT_359892 [Xylaria grammica]